jgi:CSLREA domain-containing protein
MSRRLLGISIERRRFCGSTLNAGESRRTRAPAWRAAVGLGVVALIFAVGPPTAYAATTIPVNTTADELNADGDCSLREAITAANTNTAVDACPAGQAAPTVDVISFSVTGTITLTNGQLTVTDDLTINGPGATNLTVSGNNTSRVLEVGEGTTLDLKDVTVANGTSSFGGGILNSGTLTVTNSTISANSAGSAGGISNGFNATLTVTNSTVSGNDSDFGGGIRSGVGSTVTIFNSRISGNSASGGGGGIVSDGLLTVSDSTFSGNTSSGGFGGAIYGGPLIVTNSTFSGNSAPVAGGGAFETFGEVTVTNSTLSGNSALGGGAIDHRGGGSFTLRNSIVANSTSGGNCSGVAPIADGGGNLQYPGTDCGATITSADPLLDPTGLQDNGGPTKTIALQPGSPAIDSAVLANCPATDQRGVSRPQGPGCDIGAFEVEVTNRPPSCARVLASPNRLWPPNHKLTLITLSGATDPDGDTVTLTVTGVTQDEPISGLGPGDLSPDAQAGAKSNTVFVRAERSDTGDGRIYRISFMGADGKGGSCSGTAKVGVPKTQRGTAVDSAPPSYNSFGP